MRVTRLILLALWMVALAAFPAPNSAQDDDTTSVFDVLSASGDYQLFVEAVQNLPDLMLVLDNPDSRLTVFVPDDEAFMATLEFMDIDQAALFDDVEVLDITIRHHIIPAAFSLDTLRDSQLTYLMTMLEERGLAVQIRGDRVYVNAVPIFETSRPADNGYVFAVAELLLPPEALYIPDTAPERAESTLADFLSAELSAAAPQFSIFAKALQNAPDVLAQLALTGPFTIYVPTDAAFEAYLSTTGFTLDDLFADPGLLQQSLVAHITPGHLSAGTIQAVIPLMGPHDFQALTLGGNALTLDQTEEGVFTVNGIPFAGDALFFENGILQPIEGVIDPFSDFAAQPAG